MRPTSFTHLTVEFPAHFLSLLLPHVKTKVKTQNLSNYTDRRKGNFSRF